jgi:hypothetical protein
MKPRKIVCPLRGSLIGDIDVAGSKEGEGIASYNKLVIVRNYL